MSMPTETPAEARKRRALAKAERRARWLYAMERCAACGYARCNVIHTVDRENAPEGLAYYEDVPFCAFAIKGETT